MVLGWFVKGRCDNFGVHRACHIGHLLWALIDEQYDHIYLWVVLGDSVGYILEQYGLTSLWLCYDESALTLTDRSEEVYDTHRQRVALIAFAELEFLIWEERGKVLERDTLFRQGRGYTIDTKHLFHWEILIGVTWWTDSTFHGVASLQTVLANLLLRYVYIVWRRDVVVVSASQKSVAVRSALQCANGSDGVAKRLYALVEHFLFG